MIRLICDRCKKDCGLHAVDIVAYNILNPVPHDMTDTGTPHITSSSEHKRFLLCSDCYSSLGLPNLFEEALEFREVTSQV